MKLTIELVPRTSWHSSVRACVSKGEWDIIRRATYHKAGYRCEICGGVGDAHPVECHEIWEYDDENHIQKLVGLIALCPKCHHVKHIGYASISGKLEEAKGQLIKVNDIDAIAARIYVLDAFDVWEKRSLHKWEIDISLLEDEFGIVPQGALDNGGIPRK